ncbi:hypothetical protein BSLG_004029 [Batrachochytrium salamandrivorans]|nr:hypothetical protein BSLG_004029 [Batrachochytrium salamandrivorans]
MTPEEITTPEFNQQSNVKKDDEASESNDEAPELNDEDSNSNDGAKEVKDEPSNKPTEEVGPSKTSKFFASMRKMASGFDLRSKLGKSKPKGEGAIKGNDNSGSDLDPDDSKPQPTTPEPDQQSEIADAGISQEELQAKISAMQAGEKGSSETPQILKPNVLSRPMGAKPSQSSNFQEELGKVLARKANKNGSSGESEISKHDVDPNPGKSESNSGGAIKATRLKSNTKIEELGKVLARKANKNGSSGESEISKHDVDPNPRKSESNSGGAIKSNDDSKSQQSKIVGVGSKGVPPPVLPKNRSRSPSNERKTAGADGSKKSSSVATTSQTSPGAGGKFPNFDPNQARPKPAVGSKPAVGPKPPVGSKPVVRQPKPEGQDADSNDTDKEQTGRDPSTSYQQESSQIKTPPKPAPRRLQLKKE